MALFGAGTLAVAYLLGRRFFSRSWSLVLVAILTFSCWQIEFAKFARMYAGLQFAAVCFFWSLYRYSFDGASAKRYIAVGFAALAILTSELGVFVAVLLFLPPAAWLQAGLRRTLSKQWGYLLISAALTVIGDAAIEPLIAFLYDPKASEIGAEGERVLSYASVRLTAKDALRQLVLETLEKLGWTLPPEDYTADSSQADNLRVDRPLGETGRFGPSGDLAR